MWFRIGTRASAGLRLSTPAASVSSASSSASSATSAGSVVSKVSNRAPRLSRPSASEATLQLVEPGAYVHPPDRESHIWPLHIVPRSDETALEKAYRDLRLESTEFHHAFWRENNRKFQEGKGRIEAEIVAKGQVVTAEDLSTYYKQFLQEHEHEHSIYHRETRRQNFALLRLGFSVWLSRVFSRR